MQTYFKHKYREIWKHFTSNKWHQLDHILYQKRTVSKNVDCFVDSSAECWTNHNNMVILKHRFQIQKSRRFHNKKENLHPGKIFKLRKLYPAKLIRSDTL